MKSILAIVNGIVEREPESLPAKNGKPAFAFSVRLDSRVSKDILHDGMLVPIHVYSQVPSALKNRIIRGTRITVTGEARARPVTRHDGTHAETVIHARTIEPEGVIAP